MAVKVSRYSKRYDKVTSYVLSPRQCARDKYCDILALSEMDDRMS